MPDQYRLLQAVLTCALLALAPVSASAQSQPPPPGSRMEIRLSPRKPVPPQPKAGDSLRIGPDGEILIEWITEEGQTAQRRIPRRNRVIPSVSTAVELIGGGRARYSYTVSNGPSARQNIVLFSLGVSRPDLSVQSSIPQNWWRPGAAHLDQPRVTMGSTTRESDIRPGQSKGPFVLEGPLLPGLMEALFEGYMTEQEAAIDPDAWKLSPWLLEKMYEALSFESSSVRLNIVGPKIVLSAALRREDLADAIAAEMSTASAMPEFDAWRSLLESTSASLKSTRRASSAPLKQLSFAKLTPFQEAFFNAMALNLDYLEKLP